jgi:diaminopimelate epimerase
VQRICDRHRGVGADGILVHEGGAPPRVRIWNPDGTQAEKSGNGLRIFARWLFDRGRAGAQPFEVHTAGGAVTCRVAEGGRSVQVDMGRVSFDSAEIPVAGPRREVLDEPLALAGETLRISAATIGNPHCVVLRASLSADDARRLGPLLERHPLFPNRTNVQLVRVDGPDRIALEIWERGAGHTLASGSSACAAAAVAHRLGRVGRRVTAAMPGGELAIEIGDGFAVRMTGAITAVAAIELNAEALAGV